MLPNVWLESQTSAGGDRNGNFALAIGQNKGWCEWMGGLWHSTPNSVWVQAMYITNERTGNLSLVMKPNV